MGYKIGVDRKQLSLMPVCLDDYIPEEHICRVINAFTEQLDFAALGFKYAESNKTGCRPYDPRIMLNLYIYGYLHRVRSSRRLAAETVRNIEVIWLMGELKPDDKTICNFRKDNTAALRKTFRAFVQMCRQLGLYGGEVVATDSMKVRAQNSLKNNYNETFIERELSRIEKQITEYLAALAAGDAAPSEEPSAPSGESLRAAVAALQGGQLEFTGMQEPETAAPAPVSAPESPPVPSGSGTEEAGGMAAASADPVKAALARLHGRKLALEGLKERVQQAGEVSLVDPDSRVMRSGGDERKLDVRYNMHTSVDSKHHLIVDFEVSSSSSDAGNLAAMSAHVKAALGVSTFIHLADKGYYDGQDIAACELSGVDCLVAKPAAGGVQKGEGFRKEDFAYDRARDVYICPCQQELAYKRTQHKNGGKEYKVYAHYAACNACPRKAECTTYKYREIWRLTCQDTLDLVDERTRGNKELYRKRQEIVEHVFGTVKSVWGYKQMLCRGKPKVEAEMSLAYLAYNMRRYINIRQEMKKKEGVAA